MLDGFNRLDFVNDIFNSKMYRIGDVGGFIINKWNKKQNLKIFLELFNLRFFEGGFFVGLFEKVFNI